MGVTSLSERRQATRALVAILSALLEAGGEGEGEGGAELRRQVGLLSVDTADRVEASDFAEGLALCFRAATASGGSFDGMDRVRGVAMSYDADSGTIRRVVQTAVRLALVEMCRILAAASFRSRQDAERITRRLNEAFEPAESFAADQRDVAVYRALVSLHAAATRDLTERARLLPRVVSFALPANTPALVIANRLYADATRAAELVVENRVVNPLFAPGRGIALAR